MGISQGVPSSITNIFDGARAPGYVSGVGAIYLPHWTLIDRGGTPMTTTATRLYFIPYFFYEIVSFTGLKTNNLGTGDNGDTFRMGVYQMSPTTKLPSALIIDAGEVTLTGASAVRTLAASFSPAYVGWHFMAFHANQAAGMYNMTAGDGGLTVPSSKPFIGNSDAQGTRTVAYYVDTTYGALASTAVTPTAVTGSAPPVAPYRT